MHSYSLLIANYGGVMAVPTDSPYFLVYLTMYNTGMEDQNHFNTASSPSGLCTCSCICCTLCQQTDMEPVCQRTYEGSHLIIPHGAQYRTPFPEITAPHSYQSPLIDHNTQEPYPMVATGDFCLMDPIFPDSPGDSLLFKEDDLAQLKRKGFCIPNYKEEKLQSTVHKEEKASLPMLRRMHQAPTAERRNHTRPVAGTLGFHHPRHLTPQAAGSHPTRKNAPPQPWTMTLKKTGPPPPSTRTGPAVTKTASMDMTRRAVALPTSMPCHHLHAPALGNAHRRNLVLQNPPACPVRAQASTTGACLGV